MGEHHILVSKKAQHSQLPRYAKSVKQNTIRYVENIDIVC